MPQRDDLHEFLWTSCGINQDDLIDSISRPHRLSTLGEQHAEAMTARGHRAAASAEVRYTEGGEY